MTFNDKHQQKREQQEFSRSSTEWTIHPKYDQAAGNNYDLCLVKLEKPIDLITGNSPIGNRCNSEILFRTDDIDEV